MGMISLRPRFGAGAVVAGCVLSALVGCAPPVDLTNDAFVGLWECGPTKLILTAQAIETDGTTERIAWIETAKNADYGLFTTKGARYSVFDTQKDSLVFYSHERDTRLSCTRVADGNAIQRLFG